MDNVGCSTSSPLDDGEFTSVHPKRRIKLKRVRGVCWAARDSDRAISDWTVDTRTDISRDARNVLYLWSQRLWSAERLPFCCDEVSWWRQSRDNYDQQRPKSLRSKAEGRVTVEQEQSSWTAMGDSTTQPSTESPSISNCSRCTWHYQARMRGDAPQHIGAGGQGQRPLGTSLGVLNMCEPGYSENEIDSHLRMESGRVEHWQSDICLLDDQREFGAPENDPCALRRLSSSI